MSRAAMQAPDTNPVAHLYASRAANMNASEIRELLKLLGRPEIISFAGGIPDPALFPQERIEAAYREAVFDPAAARTALQYSVSEGYQPLREWIAGHMTRKGLAAEARNILVTSGSQQALDFIAKLFVSPGDGIAVERPTYLGFLQCVRAYEPQLVDITISNGGIAVPEMSEAERERLKLLYLVPDFANPTGRSLSLVERDAVLDLADALDVVLVEDGAYADLSHDGAALPTLAGLDAARKGGIEASRVVHCGTFSKIFAPGLRVGWICAPIAVIEKLVLVKQAGDLHSSTINQIVVHRLASGCYGEQAETNRRAYAARKAAMLQALSRHMPQSVRWTQPEGGMFVWLDLPDHLDAAVLLERGVREFNVAFVPGAPFHATSPKASTLRLSFSLGTPETIDEGIRRIAALIRDAADLPPAP